jgi:hypothetical protein
MIINTFGGASSFAPATLKLKQINAATHDRNIFICDAFKNKLMVYCITSTVPLVSTSSPSDSNTN